MKKNFLKEKPVISAEDFIALFEMSIETKGFFAYYLTLFLRAILNQNGDESKIGMVLPKESLSSPAASHLDSFLEIIERIRSNIRDIAEDFKRQYFSENDVLKCLLKEKRVPAEFLKMILGGKWPKHDFNFDAVSHFKIKGHKLVPYDGDEEAPGPDIEISLKLI